MAMRTTLFLPALGLVLTLAACQKETLSEVAPAPTGVTTERTSPPFNLKATEMRGASAELSWEYAGNASAFQVQVYVGAGAAPEVLLTEYFPVERHVTVTGLSPRQDYTFQVRALGGDDGDSKWSEPGVFNAQGLLFAPPTGLRARSQAGGQVYISWKAIPGAEAYVVEVERVSLLSETILRTTVSQNHLMLFRLEDNVPYRVRVAATSTRGQGAWPEWHLFTYEPVLPYTVEEE